MIIDIKLKNAIYTIRMEGNQMSLECTREVAGKTEGETKSVTSHIGYYGPGQIEHAINRIIAEDMALDGERGGLREFLRVYKSIHQTIAAQVDDIKEQIKIEREK